MYPTNHTQASLTCASPVCHLRRNYSKDISVAKELKKHFQIYLMKGEKNLLILGKRSKGKSVYIIDKVESIIKWWLQLYKEVETKKNKFQHRNEIRKFKTPNLIKLSQFLGLNLRAKKANIIFRHQVIVPCVPATTKNLLRALFISLFLRL